MKNFRPLTTADQCALLKRAEAAEERAQNAESDAREVSENCKRLASMVKDLKQQLESAKHEAIYWKKLHRASSDLGCTLFVTMVARP